jgi:hypothetical protein
LRRPALITRLLVLPIALMGLGAGCGAETPPATAFSPGLVATANHRLSAAAAGKLGARVVRVEFDIGTPAKSMRGAVAAIVRRGARPLLLAGFHGRMPTEGEARNLGAWAAAFGTGGSFWAKHRRHRLPVRLIEFGNETSYRDQYGDTWSDQSFKDRAELYATRFAQAHRAIAATRRPVGLLAQGDDGGTASSVWVNHMFGAVPNLGKLVAGWTVHPYGPRDQWQPKLRRLIAQTAANGAPSRIPIDVTEYGLSSSGGAALSGNYGWPANQTYAQAAAALRATVAGMRGDGKIGKRLRLFLVYSAQDLRRPGTTNDREAYFGALRHDLTAKGAYTAEVRRLFGG